MKKYMKVIFFISLDATVFAFCASGLTRIGPIYRLTANKPIGTKNIQSRDMASKSG